MVPVVIGAVLVIGVVLTTVAGLLIGAGSSSDSSGTGSLSFFGDRIGQLNIEGVLGEGPAYPADTKVLAAQVRQWTDNKSIKAIVLRVNSPGGAVSATQDLHQALEEFRDTGRPILTSMGDIAASGGYYAAMASEPGEVYANEGSLTGSIGVILGFYDFREFQDKIGVHPYNVKSGQFKDIGSGSREMTPEEKALLETMIDDVYNQFLDVVVANRSENVRKLLADRDGRKPQDVTEAEIRAHVKELCDGRIFSGRQAYLSGMVDGTRTLDQVLDRARKLTNLPENAPVVVAPVRQQGLFGSISGLAGKLSAMPEHRFAGARLEYRFDGL